MGAACVVASDYVSSMNASERLVIADHAMYKSTFGSRLMVKGLSGSIIRICRRRRAEPEPNPTTFSCRR